MIAHLLLEGGIHGGGRGSRGRPGCGSRRYSRRLSGRGLCLCGLGSRSLSLAFSGTLSGTISRCSICCVLRCALKDIHQAGHILITSEANFTITCWRTLRLAKHLWQLVAVTGEHLTNYQRRGVGTEVDVQGQGGGSAGQEQDTVGNHCD